MAKTRPFDATKYLDTPEAIAAYITETNDQQRAAELFAIRKMRPTVIEYRALADRFSDAVQLMQIACNNENFADFCAAWISLHDIAEQTKFLNTGIEHAILACENREF